MVGCQFIGLFSRLFWIRTPAVTSQLSACDSRGQIPYLSLSLLVGKSYLHTLGTRAPWRWFSNVFSFLLLCGVSALPRGAVCSSTLCF